MAQLRKVMRLTYDAGFMRMGWPERVGGLGGSNLLRAYLGEALTARDLVEPGIYSMPEVLAPTMIDFAPEDLAAEMVPRLLRGEEIWCQGFSEPGTGSNLASLACRATRTDDGLAGQRPEGVDEPGPVRAALRAPDTDGHARVGAPRDHGAVRRHGQPGHHRAADRDDARRRGVLRGLLRRRPRAARPGARRGRRRLVHRHGPAALRAQHGAVAPRRVPAAAAGAAGDRRCRPARWTRRRRRGDRTAVGLPGPVAGDPAPPGRRRDARGRRRRSTRCWWRRPSRPCSTSWPRGSGPRWRSATTRPAHAGAPSSSTRGRRRIYGGSAEIQRNIIARRLLELGDDR